MKGHHTLPIIRRVIVNKSTQILILLFFVSLLFSCATPLPPMDTAIKEHLSPEGLSYTDALQRLKSASSDLQDNVGFAKQVCSFAALDGPRSTAAQICASESVDFTPIEKQVTNLDTRLAEVWADFQSFAPQIAMSNSKSSDKKILARLSAQVKATEVRVILARDRIGGWIESMRPSNGSKLACPTWQKLSDIQIAESRKRAGVMPRRKYVETALNEVKAANSELDRIKQNQRKTNGVRFAR
jgi:hypothetical protein